MPDEPALREQAQAAVRGGRLPARRHDRLWGGPGTGAVCVLCHRRIGREENELEMEFDRDRPGTDRYFIHPGCFAAWEFERMKGNGAMAAGQD